MNINVTEMCSPAPSKARWSQQVEPQVQFHDKNEYQNSTMPKLSNTPTCPLKIALQNAFNSFAPAQQWCPKRLITHALMFHHADVNKKEANVLTM